MKYYCENCGSVLDEDDLEEYSEGRPGAYGAPCEETFWVCPECGHIPAEYDYQDKTCGNCIIHGTDACPYGFDRSADEKICSDFMEDEE